ncbi:MAG: hypothetical protein WAV48_01870 [Candidatus Magasanikiibacteriota bacterium]
MSTVRDAVLVIRGPGGAIVRSMPDAVKQPFLAKAEELGQQIAHDNGVTVEDGDVPDGATLSDEAEKLLSELKGVKRQILKK